MVLADKSIPDITYATVKVGVSPLNTSVSPKASPEEPPSSAPASKEKKKTGKG
jgi:hypothetical protein